MNKKISAKIKKLPAKSGVYLFKDAPGRILYVGKAANLKNRVSSHFKNNNSLIGQFRQKIAAIDYIETENETQALILEDQLIKKYQPKFNIQQKDDKSYFWVAISDDEWPRLQIIHHLKKNGHKLKSDLIGPFTNGTELKKTLRALRKILPYRTCKNSYEKPCLQWHLGLCPAHKPDLGLKIQTSKLKNDYLISLNALKQLLRLYAGEPIRTEAYDISNIQGTDATGSMIVFAGGKTKKSDYRKFKIKTVRGANDVAMIKEVLRRRLNHPEWPQPDLILIDGGRPQLNAAVAVTANRFHQSALIALAKKDEEIYTKYSGKTLRLNALPLYLRLTFQAIRNEAHRFAIKYYRHLHGKKFRTDSKENRRKN